MILRPPISTRTDPLLPYTTLFRAAGSAIDAGPPQLRRQENDMVSRSPIVQGRLRTFFQQVGIQVGAAPHADALHEACAMGRHLLGRLHHLLPLLLPHDPGIKAAVDVTVLVGEVSSEERCVGKGGGSKDR